MGGIFGERKGKLDPSDMGSDPPCVTACTIRGSILYSQVPHAEGLTWATPPRRQAGVLAEAVAWARAVAKATPLPEAWAEAAAVATAWVAAVQPAGVAAAEARA